MKVRGNDFSLSGLFGCSELNAIICAVPGTLVKTSMAENWGASFLIRVFTAVPWGGWLCFSLSHVAHVWAQQLPANACSQGLVQLHFPYCYNLHFALKIVFRITSDPEWCEEDTCNCAELSSILDAAFQMCGGSRFFQGIFFPTLNSSLKKDFLLRQRKCWEMRTMNLSDCNFSTCALLQGRRAVLMQLLMLVFP